MNQYIICIYNEPVYTGWNQYILVDYPLTVGTIVSVCKVHKKLSHTNKKL